MSSAMGILKWPPNVFWGSTMYEYTTAMKGHLLSNGVKLEGGMTRTDYLKLKREEEKSTRKLDD